jgi:hypothetical protein
MTQTLDALDVGGKLSELGSTRATGVPASAAQKSESKFGTFAITFGIAFAVLYTVFERLNWPLFTYHPVTGALEFWKQMAGKGPPMFWYGWVVLAAGAALVVAGIATMVSGPLLRRATLFCCALAALWPTSLVVLTSFSADWASMNAEYMNSVWAAGVPGVVGAAAVTYFVPSQWAQRMWTSWLLIAPICGLIVLGYSLKPWFTH